MQSIARYEGRATLSTWVHRVAYFRYTHWLREQRRDRHWHVSLDRAADCVDPATNSQWESLYLREALAQLSEDHRDTFVLHYVQQLSVPEVAEVLGVPPGTVQSRLFHARRRLRDLLRDGTSSSQPGDSDPKAVAPDKGNIQEVIIR